MVIVFAQVALHLLSEKEKKDLIQLVNTMVSYSITYKNIKSDHLPSNLRQEVAIDASVLSFDPPVGDLINFKVIVFGLADHIWIIVYYLAKSFPLC